MILKCAYNNSSKEIFEKLNSLFENSEFYNEDVFKERKNAFKIKNEWGAFHSPFVILLDDNKKPLKAFYSEDNSCNLENILNFLNYENTSN